MSRIYSISIKLDIACNKNNIEIILKRGIQRGFKYYDTIGEHPIEMPAVLDANTVARKIIEAHVTKPEFGPRVITNLEGDTSAFLSFYKTDDDRLEFNMGAIECPKKLNGFIDLDYYIRLCLDLCRGFPILEITTRES